jgi:hypothetical protein
VGGGFRLRELAVYDTMDEFEHVVFQRDDGSWSSKLGELADIRNATLEALGGSGPFEYSPVVLFMQRPREAHPLADTGLILI